MKILDSKFIQLLLLLLSVAYPMYFVSFGVDFTDTFFHFNNITDYNETGNINSSMTFLSTLFLSNWGKLVGHTIINYRILNVLLCMLIILTPLLYFKEKLNLKYYFILVLITSVTYVSLLKSLIGYDSISDFFILNSFFSLVLFLNKQKIIYLITTSIFIALATATRIPDVLIIFVSILVLFIAYLFKLKTFKEFLFNSVYILFFSLFFYFIIVSVVFDSFSKYWTLLTVKNLDQTYSIYNLISKYFFSLLFVLKIFIVLVVLIILLKYKMNNNFVNRIKAIVCLCTLLLFLLFKVGGSSYFIALSWTFTAIYCVIFLCLLRSKNLTKVDKLIVIMSMCFSFLPALGSNTGLLKVNAMYYILFLISYFEFKERKIIMSLFLVVFFFGIYEKFNNTYDDQPFCELNTTFNCPFIQNIKSSKSRTKAVNEVEKLTKKLIKDKNEVLFYGMNSHIYNTVTSLRSNLSKSFDRSFNNKYEIGLFDQYLKKNRNVYFIVTNKYVWGDGEDFENSAFKRLMQKYHYKRENFNEYIVFEPILIR